MRLGINAHQLTSNLCSLVWSFCLLLCFLLSSDSSVSRVRHLNDIRSSSAYVLFFAKRAPGVAVKTEAEVQADIDAYEATKPKAAYSGYSSSYGSSRLSELD